MYTYSYSYKSDSIGEIIGIVYADTYEDAVLKVSEIKRLPIDSILDIFNIKIK
jgi:hypothetical protein